ncbi:DUF5134 domain-containing protein [Nocardia ninae]|uniref:DUF5134 domain-containing protein n=1 Tax=Nocardia ninae NBRC 108245 TaxID=1210091 RepID=A0A511MJ69_9NOCA|nr:DUF5134 domain-containing protein [Nocardia ninae]GEM40511.1 hypothetical protein NN4_50300 [Nocardia ninae NBRC 108245]
MDVAQFVQEYAALRWSVVAAFLLAVAIVLGRLAAPLAVGNDAGGSVLVPVAEPDRRQRDSTRKADSVPTGGYHESDAAHLIMCLVMLAMLVFPAGASPVAVRGVLTAMTVVFAILLASRILEWRSTPRATPMDRLVPLGYHTVTAAAMLYAMSGHAAPGHTGGPAMIPALGLAALFAADALLVTFAVGRPAADTPGHLGILLRSGGCVAALTGPRQRSAVVPHVVMDLGTAYMLIAAVSS